MKVLKIKNNKNGKFFSNIFHLSQYIQYFY